MSQEILQACMASLDRWMAALNAYDAKAMDAEMHFPHVRLAGGKLVVYEKAGSNPMDLFDRLRREDDSLVLPGVGADERDMLIEADPRVFHTTPHYEGYSSVLARLGPLAPAQLSPFLLRRWRAIAPRRYVAGFDAAGSREGG